MNPNNTYLTFVKNEMISARKEGCVMSSDEYENIIVEVS